MLLSAQEIKKLAKEDGMITPFEERNLQSVSYDITAGNIARVFNRLSDPIDLNDKENIKLTYCEIDITDGYLIKPNEYMLVKSGEKYTLPDDIAAYARPRTTLSRLGLILTSQHFNPSFSGYIYYGLLNVTPNILKIYPGTSIGQIVFEKVYGALDKKNLYKNKTSAQYQNENEFIIPDVNNTRPEIMAYVNGILGE